jgi:hypothetical protein
MMIGNGIWDLWSAVLLALTPAERLAAAQKGGPSLGRADYSVLILGIVLVGLVILLAWVSWRRGPWKRGAARELFWDGAVQRGLGARERQILVAIATRSGLRRHHEVFTRADAFDHGAERLLAECTRDRTTLETERLQREVSSLREKMGYEGKSVPVEPVAPSSSRNVPVGASVELSQKGESAILPAVVVRNDDLEIAVELQTPVADIVGQAWTVRYQHDEQVWEFETVAISSEDMRVSLSHTERVRVAEPDSYHCVSVEAPAVVARFPFMQATTTDSNDESSEGTDAQWFELVRAVVTEVSASNLSLRSTLDVRAGERVLVMFALTSAEATDDTGQPTHVVGHIGRVRHRQTSDENASMTVDLLGLTDSEAAELVRLADAAASCVAADA